MQEILIASTSIDSVSFEPVVRNLGQKGHSALVYEADRVAKGDVNLEIIVNDSESGFYYGQDPIVTEQIRAAWFRHPNLINFERKDKLSQHYIEREIADLQDSIWDFIPQEKWLNAPYDTRRAQTKISQLIIAKSLGFEIPDTIVSNQWDSIKDMANQGELVIKMSRGFLGGSETKKGLYTTRLTEEDLSKLVSCSPFPAIFQTYESKAREWRVTVVGEQTFDVAIYTDDSAKDDWRKHQTTGKVEFKEEKFDPDIKEKCFKFLGELGLKYGAFDFIEGEDGKITFLEANPSGHFIWLERKLGLPISAAIADELIKIVKNN